MTADSAGMSFQADIAADSSLASGLALDAGDGEYLPIVKVQPIYPRRALQRGIQGYVIVEFTVTKNGSVFMNMMSHKAPLAHGTSSVPWGP